LLPQTHSLSGWIGYKTLTADVDGDGRDDLIWNQLTATTNRIYVALAKETPEGDFDLTKPYQEHPIAGNWSGYEIFVGDVNRDGRDDLIWNEKSQTTNRIYVGLGTSEGTFDLSSPLQEHPLSGWVGYRTLMADVDGDGDSDLIWNQTNMDPNRTYVGLSDGINTFDLTTQKQDHPVVCCWANYSVQTADVNGDGQADLVWNKLVGGVNRTYVGLGPVLFDVFVPMIRGE
ncbi:MAG: VCBS repeat-containing protein, partial [Candidatus Promineifilaceae bacterium]